MDEPVLNQNQVDILREYISSTKPEIDTADVMDLFKQLTSANSCFYCQDHDSFLFCDLWLETYELIKATLKKGAVNFETMMGILNTTDKAVPVPASSARTLKIYMEWLVKTAPPELKRVAGIE